MIISLDIGGSAIKGAVAASPTELQPLGRVATPPNDFDAFVAAVAAMAAEAPTPPQAPIAIAITGVIDPETGIIKCANIPCVDGRHLGAQLKARLSRPVLVANDADCFALAEAVAGAGRGHHIVFGAILGSGVGGGLVIDGRIVAGPGGFAGEWGHGPVAATSAGSPPVAIPHFQCGCGLEGCVNTIGGARGTELLHRHLHGIDLPSTEIVASWLAGDSAAERTIACQIDLLASPLALTINIVGAGMVPVGGGLAQAPQFIARLDQEVRRRMLRRLDTAIVVPGELSLDPGLVGAAILGLSECRS
jgi:N-acetylglucosamine kinase